MVYDGIYIYNLGYIYIYYLYDEFMIVYVFVS